MADSIEDASMSLDASLRHFVWYVMCGVGEKDGNPAIHVYVEKKSKPSLLKLEWKGFPLVIHKSGRPRPAQT